MSTKLSPASEHPAQFSPEIITLFRQIIPSGVHVHDCNCGPAVRLGMLLDSIGCTFSGTDIEPVFLADHRVCMGDATDIMTYPAVPYWLVTSPAYPNGISDSWAAKDSSVRRTYRWAKGRLLGRDEDLHENNQGRWGYRGTGKKSRKRKRYWEIAEAQVACWTQTPCDTVVLNVSDFLVKGVAEPVVAEWEALMLKHGWEVHERHEVRTRRYKNGSDESRDERVQAESVTVYRRSAKG